MRIVKLAAGETLTMAVDRIDEVEGQYGPQYDIQGHADDGEPVRIYLGLSTADRQFERIGLDARSAEGQSIVIGKVQKGNKAYVNIDRAGPAVAVPARQSAPPTADDGPPPESDDEYQARMRAESAPRHAVAPQIPMTASEQRQHTLDSQPSAWSDAVLHTATDYEVCVDRAGQILERQGRKHGFGFDGAAVQAMAFSIYGKTEERARRGGLR